MRTILTMLVVLVTVACVQTPPNPAAADEPGIDATHSELTKLQGLWTHSSGGAVHRDGKQVVYQPDKHGKCFFIRSDRLIWLDQKGKPSGEEWTIKLDVATDPKRITFTPSEDGQTMKPIHGIYSMTETNLRLDVGLDGGPAPGQFLERNKPVKGVDGREWLISRMELESVRTPER